MATEYPVKFTDLVPSRALDNRKSSSLQKTKEYLEESDESWFTEEGHLYSQVFPKTDKMYTTSANKYWGQRNMQAGLSTRVLILECIFTIDEIY